VIHDREDVLEASNVSWFAFSGLKRPGDGWKPGAYRGIYILTRGNEPVVTVEREVIIDEAG
jgi:hypothetical protein